MSAQAQIVSEELSMISALDWLIGMSDIISHCKCVDGSTRAVYRDADGRQYVVDNDGEPVYGIWILDDHALDEAPLIVGE